MDLTNGNRIACAIGSINAVTTGDREIASWLIDIIEQLESMRLPSFSGHPICTDLVSVREDVHCESTAQEIHAGVPA